MRIRALLAFLAVVPFLGPAAPARAETGAVTFAGSLELPAFPCSDCNATFDSTVAAGALTIPVGVGVVASVHADFTYAEECMGGQALFGAAEGIVEFNALTGALVAKTGFQWQRVGLVGVISNLPPSEGIALAGAAVWVPTNVLPTCTGAPVTVVVAGAVVAVI